MSEYISKQATVQVEFLGKPQDQEGKKDNILHTDTDTSHTVHMHAHAYWKQAMSEPVEML